MPTQTRSTSKAKVFINEYRPPGLKFTWMVIIWDSLGNRSVQSGQAATRHMADFFSKEYLSESGYSGDVEVCFSDRRHLGGQSGI